jgi:hypothetical protein
MAGGKAVYSFQEVSKHNDRKDCWLIIAGKVYDVSPFMEEHPGGDEVLLACTGEPPLDLIPSPQHHICSETLIDMITQADPGNGLNCLTLQARTRPRISTTSGTRRRRRS